MWPNSTYNFSFFYSIENLIWNLNKRLIFFCSAGHINFKFGWLTLCVCVCLYLHVRIGIPISIWNRYSNTSHPSVSNICVCSLIEQNRHMCRFWYRCLHIYTELVQTINKNMYKCRLFHVFIYKCVCSTLCKLLYIYVVY